MPKKPASARPKKSDEERLAMYGIVLSGPRDVGGSGWMVSLWRQGQRHRKHFSFKAAGGRDAALRVAQAWRDEVVRQFKPMLRIEMASRMRRNNKSGTVGIHLSRWPDGSPRAWIAGTYLQPGRKVARHFSIQRYGLEGARKLAEIERARQLAEMQGRRHWHDGQNSAD